MKWLIKKPFLTASVEQLLRRQIDSWTSKTMGRGQNRKIKGYFSLVDGARIDSDKNIFFTSMNFDVGATISLLVKS